MIGALKVTESMYVLTFAWWCGGDERSGYLRWVRCGDYACDRLRR